MNENREEMEKKIVQEKQSESQFEEQVIEEESLKEDEPNKTLNTSKKSKLSEAQELIENSKELVSKIEAEVADSKNEVSQAAKEFDETKHNFKNTTFKSAKTLLEKLGFEYTPYDEVEPFELSTEEEGCESFTVQDINTGRFTGFVLALITALATLGALVYFALTKLNIDPKTLTLNTAIEKVDPVLTWIGTLGGNTGGNMVVGAVILGLLALIVGWIVYAIRVNIKANKNLDIAKEVYEKSKEYCIAKGDCKVEMEKIDSHLREATEEINNFDIILNEKVGTLKRVLHVEGSSDKVEEYHPSSKKSMSETEKIMQGIEYLLNTSITKEGRLNFQSVQALNNSKAVYADYLARIYN